MSTYHPNDQRRYFGDFDNATDVMSSFSIDQGTVTDEEILFASYGGDGYSGTAIVVYRRDGKLYEANSSHCSCNGLEWEPEETTAAALSIRDLWNLDEEGKRAFRALWPKGEA